MQKPNDDLDEIIAHIGVKRRSGRYPYGSGDRPYQSTGGKKSGGSSKTSKESGLVTYAKHLKNSMERKRRIREQNKAAEERAKAREAAKRHVEDKERVLRSGSASEVLKYQGELTNAELQNAYNRIDWERKLKSFSNSERKSGMDKFDDYMQKVKKINGWVSTGTDVYNTLASIYNATESGRSNPWPKINKGDQKKDKK